jgi:hypothetical protein
VTIDKLAPTLRVLNPDGSYGRALSGWTKITVGGDEGEAQVLTVSYNAQHPTAVRLGDQVPVVLLLGGVEYEDMRFVIDESATDEVAERDVSTWKGQSSLISLDYARVYPVNFPDVVPPGEQCLGETAGSAFDRLLGKAQARGWMPTLANDFSAALDSSGQAWGATTAEFIDQGTTYYDLVTKWASRKFAVAKMAGQTLQLFAYGHHGDDLTATVILRRGYELDEGPVSKSTRDLVSVMLATTETTAVERTDASSYSSYGRREGYLSQTQVADTPTLQSIADGTLALTARSRDSFTYGLTLAKSRALPFVHYARGDVLTLRVKGAERQLRLRSLNLAFDASGAIQGSVAFGAKYKTPDEQLKDRLDQLTAASQDGGAYGTPVIAGSQGAGGGTVDPADPGGYDTVAPGSVTGLTLANVFFGATPRGERQILATFTWSPTTVNQDGTPCNDLAYYQLEWYDPVWWGTIPPEHQGEYYVPTSTTPSDRTTRVIEFPLTGRNYHVRIRAVDFWGNVGAWSEGDWEIDAPTVAPDQPPSTPVVEAVLFGSLQVTWDGLEAGGVALDDDIRSAEVHMSTTTGFTPSAATLVAEIGRPAVGTSASTVVPDLTPSTTYYVKLRLKDVWGVVGPASTQATGVPVDVFATVSVGPEDITFNDYGNFSPDGSFERADARQALLDVGALTGGAVFANVGTAAAHGSWVARLPANAAKIQWVSVQTTATGAQWYVKAWVRVTGNLTATPTVTLNASFVDTGGNVLANTGAIIKNGSWTLNTWALLEGRIGVTTPGTTRLARIDFSATVSGMVAGQVVEVDAIDTRQVATNVLIADAAINDAKIANLSASKITAGTLSAAVTISGSIATATSGARVTLDSSGMKAYNASSVQTVGINSDGTAFFSGTLGNTEVSGYVRALSSAKQVTMLPSGMTLGSSTYPAVLTSPGFAPLEQAMGFFGQGGDSAQPFSRFQLVMTTSIAALEGVAAGCRTGMSLYTLDAHPFPAGATQMKGPIGWLQLGFPTPESRLAPLGSTGETFTGVGGGKAELRNHWYWPQYPPAYNAIDSEGTYGREAGDEISFIGTTRQGQQAGMLVHSASATDKNAVTLDFRRATADGNTQADAIHANHAWVQLRAAAFTVSSDSSTKRDIAEIDWSALKVIRENPAKRWRRKGDDHDGVHIGPMADNLPYEVLGVSADYGEDKSISILDMAGLLWKAIAELDERTRT